MESRNCPGMDADRLAHPAPVDDEERVHRGRRCAARSRAPSCARAATRAAGGDGRRGYGMSLAPSFGSKWAAMARARRAGSCTRSGMTCVSSPKPAAVARVIGPMRGHRHARPSAGGSSARGNSAQKFRTVDELVKVTTSTRRSASALRRPAACSARRARAVGGDLVDDGAQRRQLAHQHVAGLGGARQQDAVPGAISGRSRSTRPSATYSPGTDRDPQAPARASASAVAGPMAAIRHAREDVAAAPRLAARRRRTISTPLTLVNTTHRYSAARASAASSGAHESGGSIAMVGTSITRAARLLEERREGRRPARARASPG